MNRRVFLQSVAAAPMIFGLGDLLSFAQDDPKKPDWVAAALKRMKDTGRNGLVLIAPAEDADRKAMGRSLLAVVEAKDAGVREVFVEAVVVCVTREISAAWLKAEGNRVVLDPEGRILASDALAVDKIEPAAAFAESCRTLLHGEKGDRLRAAVDRVKARLEAGVRTEVESAIDAVDTDGTEPGAAMEILKRRADMIAPWLVFARLDAVYDKGRARLRRILDGLCTEERQLPYGATLPKFVDICGHWKEVERPEEEGVAFECGMARAGGDSRKFLKFLTK